MGAGKAKVGEKTGRSLDKLAAERDQRCPIHRQPD